MAAKDQDAQQLAISRVVQGQFNRLSASNLEGVFAALEGVYAAHPRGPVTAAVVRAFMAAATAESAVLESYLVLPTALLALVYNVVGVEQGAQVVQEAVQQWHAASDAVDALEETGGEADEQERSRVRARANKLAVVIAETHKFGLVGAALVFDVVRHLGRAAPPVTEARVETVLKVLRSCAHSLQREDPQALRAIVQQMHAHAPPAAERSPRFRFVLGALDGLLKKQAQRGGSLQSSHETFAAARKAVAAYLARRGRPAAQPLRASLRDIVDAETRGKWWVVGAAWTGIAPEATPKAAAAAAAAATAKAAAASSELDAAAARLGLKTEIRRRIFAALMTSEDYLDACAKIAALAIPGAGSGVGQRDVPRVLLKINSVSARYNPFFHLVAAQLCRDSRAHQITFQYALWDFGKLLGAQARTGMALEVGNTAQFYAQLVFAEALPLLSVRGLDLEECVSSRARLGFAQQLFARLLLLEPPTTHRSKSAETVLVKIFARLMQEPRRRAAKRRKRGPPSDSDVELDDDDNDNDDAREAEEEDDDEKGASSKKHAGAAPREFLKQVLWFLQTAIRPHLKQREDGAARKGFLARTLTAEDRARIEARIRMLRHTLFEDSL